MNKIISNQYANLVEVAKEHHPAYVQAEPFPSIYFEDFFNSEMLGSILSEFPDLVNEDVQAFNNKNEKKYASKGEKSFGDNTRRFMHYLNSEPFLEFLQILTGIDEILLSDPYFIGGGLHEIKRGGLLKVHADFNKHGKCKLDRRINALVYLNKDWKEKYGGHFELWDKEMKSCVKKILPTFNTLAIFSTTDYSYHGHPDPLNCPADRSRKSLALYYYSYGRPDSEKNGGLLDHSTLFQPRAGHVGEVISSSDKHSLSVKRIIKELVPPILIRGAKYLLKAIN